MRLTSFFSFLVFLLLSNNINANSTELTSKDIEHFAKSFLLEKFPSTDEEKIQITVATLDPRIVIKPCSVPLTANIPEKSNARNVNIKVNCDESTPWKVYLSAKVEITKAVLIAKNTINKGDTLDESNIELTYVAINKVRGKKITDKNVILGAKAKRRIAEGKLISKSSICLVCKGDAVTIIASSESFSIKTQGIALSSGNINDQIRVRNTRSNKVITPKIKSHTQVIINL